MSDLPDWPALMKPATAAAYLETSLSTLSRLRDRKELPPVVLLCQSPRYRRSDLDAYIARMKPEFL